MSNKRGVIYVSVYMESYKRSQSDQTRFEAMQWKHRITNALRCYSKAKSQAERRELVKFYKEEFQRLGWSIPE